MVPFEFQWFPVLTYNAANLLLEITTSGISKDRNRLLPSVNRDRQCQC